MADSLGYQTLVENYPELYKKCIQLDPNLIAIYLKPKRILSDDVFHYLDNPQHDRNEKARKLLSAIEYQVRLDPESQKIFLQALEDAENHSTLRIKNSGCQICIASFVVLIIAMLLVPVVVFCFSSSKGSAKDKLLVDTPPSLDILSSFPKKGRVENSTINVIERVEVKCQQFGKYILNDSFGNKVEVSDKRFRLNYTAFCQEIFTNWLSGTGKHPVSWTTFLWALNMTGTMEDLVEIIKSSIAHQIMDTPLKTPYDMTARFSDKLKEKYTNQPVIDPYQKLLSTVKKDWDTIPVLNPIVKLKDELPVSETIHKILPGSRILFSGKPGVGKSTLTRYMALKWAEGEILSHCVLTVRVELFVTISDLSQLLNKAYKDFTKVTQVETEIKEVEGKGVCFILDAYDEYIHAARGRDDFIDDLLKRESLKFATIVMTSRNCSKIDELINTNTFTHKAELIEFNRNDIDNYVDQLPSDLKSTISKVFALNFNVRQMCLLPLHLTMVLNLALVDNDRLSVIDTETMLYEDFLILSIKQYEFRNGWSPGSMERCLQNEQNKTELCTTFKLICKFAYTTLFQPFDMGLFNEDEKFLLKSRVDLFMNISLFGIEIEQGRREEKYYYTFTHRTFQEYLAAFHMSRLPFEEVQLMLDDYPKRHDSTLIWKFYFGVIGKYKYIDGIENKALVSTFKAFLPVFSTRNCSIEYDSLNKFLMDFAYEARMTTTLESLMDETNLITGPNCDNYTLYYPLMWAEDCIRFLYILTWVKIRSLTITLSQFLDYENCKAVFQLQKSNKFSSQLHQVEHLTFIDMFRGQQKVSADNNVVMLLFSLFSTPNLLKFVYSCGPDYPISDKYNSDYQIRKTTQGYAPFEVNLMETLLTWLRDMPQLKILQMYCVLDDISLEVLSNSMCHWEHFNDLLAIIGPDPSDEFIDKFSSSLSNISSMESLSLSWIVDKAVTSEYAVSVISKSITNLERLKNLSIDCNSINSQKNNPCTGIVARSLVSLSSLECLTLAGHSFGPAESHLFTSALSKSSVTHLMFEGALFSSAAEQRLILTSLKEMQHLKGLVFHGQCKTLIHTCHTIQNEQSLSGEVDLAHLIPYICNLNKQGSSFLRDYDFLTEIRNILPELRQLENLEVSYMCVRWGDARAFSATLSQLTNLQFLKFSMNHINDDSYKFVLQQIVEMGQLKHLHLYKNFEILGSQVHINYPLNFSKLKNLTYLDISTFHLLDEEAISSLNSLPDLQTFLPHHVFRNRPETESYENKINLLLQSSTKQNITVIWCDKFNC